MTVAALNVLVSLLLGFGAVQELVVPGIRGGEAQPLAIGLAGTAVSLLLALSGVAHWRRWPSARTLLAAAGALLVAFHAYAALPPHRNVGLLALLVGAGYGVFLLAIALRRTPFDGPSRPHVSVG